MAYYDAYQAELNCYGFAEMARTMRQQIPEEELRIDLLAQHDELVHEGAPMQEFEKEVIHLVGVSNSTDHFAAAHRVEGGYQIESNDRHKEGPTLAFDGEAAKYWEQARTTGAERAHAVAETTKLKELAASRAQAYVPPEEAAVSISEMMNASHTESLYREPVVPSHVMTAHNSPSQTY